MIKNIFINEKNKNLIENICKKSFLEDDLIDSIENKVRAIIAEVKKEGDKALLEYTVRFDKVKLEPEEILVKPEELKAARREIDEDLFSIIKEAIVRIKNYHLHQKENSWFTPNEQGIILGQVLNPIERVGLYIPGGTAAYPSTLMMSAIPAMIAGVKEIAMVNPPSLNGKINPYVLATAAELGVSEIYKIGGAQAVAALAYGTETVKKVDKIVGPGNTYVTVAKKNVFGIVDIDMLAGPSEILIWADEKANPQYVASDLISQAEHDREATSILITHSVDLAKKVQEEIKRQVKDINRKEIIQFALKNHGKIIVAENQKLIIEFINRFAPEHLELQIDEPWQKLGEIKNAGSIFIGAFSPEPLGDYWAGANHILPTARGAKNFSPLSVSSFMKKSSIICYDQKRLKQAGSKIARLARLEGLNAHARSVEIRNQEE